MLLIARGDVPQQFEQLGGLSVVIPARAVGCSRIIDAFALFCRTSRYLRGRELVA